MLHWSRTRRSFITQKIKIHKILLSCGLVIHVNASMLKTKASNPRPGSRPRPDTDKAKDYHRLVRAITLCVHVHRANVDCLGLTVGQADRAFLVYQVRKVNRELAVQDRRVSLEDRVLTDLMECQA